MRPSAPSNSSRAWLGVVALAAGCGFNSKPGTQPDGGIEPLDGAPGGGSAGCYGPDGWRVCLDAAPSQPISLTGMLDTDKSDAKNPCAKQQPAGWTDALQPEACFVVGTTVTVVSLDVTGRRPLVIVGTTGISVMSLLDVGSHRMPHAVGPGAGPTECKMFARAPGSGQGGGGGAGGSFAFAGADGGTGNGVFEVGGLVSGSDIGPPARLRGGCAGQPGGRGKPDDAGAGGGAVYLVSGGAISIPGKIDASGAGGGGGDATDGGGGGGAGGMIVLHGASIATTSSTILLADGGGGGGGGSFGGPKGDDGEDPAVAIPIAPAPGGPGGVVIGATGGNGGGGFSAAIAATIGMSGDTGAGGGGGGGGGGYIQTNHDLKTAVTSPFATIPP